MPLMPVLFKDGDANASTPIPRLELVEVDGAYGRAVSGDDHQPQLQIPVQIVLTVGV
jgi:hypothetical protein